MVPIAWTIDADEASVAIYTLLEKASKTAYLSVPHLDFNVLVKSPDDGKKHLFYSIVERACERGVNVHILIGEEFLRSTQARTPPSRCVIRYVNRFGPKVRDETPFWPDQLEERLGDGSLSALGNKSIFVHNQRYLVIDDQVAIVGSFDLGLSSNLSGAFATQKVRHYPVAALVKPNHEFLKFVQLNWATMGISTQPVEHGFFFGSRHDEKHTELRVMVHMIREAKNLLFVQTQYLSSHENTYNTFMLELAKRLARAHADPKDQIRCIIFTNVDGFQDTPNMFWTRQPHLTVDFLDRSLTKLGVPDTSVFKEQNRLFVGSVSSLHESTFFKGSVLIQDMQTALITSSTIRDYSIGPRRCNELGIRVTDGKENHLVYNLFHQIMQDHLALLDYKKEVDKNKEYTAEDYIRLCYENKGRVVRFRKEKNSYLFRFYQMGDWVKRKILGDIT
jgi:hypothetical protein